MSQCCIDILVRCIIYCCFVGCCSLRAWYALKNRTDRYRQGLHKLNHAWLRLRYKLAYLMWPGRRECILAKQMHDYLRLKHKDHIRLVDCPEPKKIVEVVSFVSKHRPTFAQRAVNLRIVSSKAELDGVQYYENLCRSILQMWQGAIKVDVDNRMRALAVRSNLSARSMRKCMMKWVLLTPKTAYRRVVWIVKQEHRAHDAHLHRQMLMREYKQVTREKSRMEEAEYKVQVGTLIVCVACVGTVCMVYIRTLVARRALDGILMFGSWFRGSFGCITP
jgi:hypothetical protein